jgi:predicted phosphoribosyltransferase
MVFRNRGHAARLLVERLAPYRGQNPLVLGVPRGGVPMAQLIADALGGELDLVLVRKLRAPDQPELALGAVDESGAVFRGPYFGLAPAAYIEREIRAQHEILQRRRELYGGSPAADPSGRVVIIVDDGIATGASMIAAIHAVRARRPRRIVVAVAVAPLDTLDTLRAEADEIVCLHAPASFYAVGQFFSDFSEVSDAAVVEALAKAGRQEKVGHD